MGEVLKVYIKKINFVIKKYEKDISLCIVVFSTIVAISFYRNRINYNYDEKSITTFSEISNEAFSETLDGIDFLQALDDNIKLDENFIPTFATISYLTNMKDLQRHLYVIDKRAYVLLEELDIVAFARVDFYTDLEGELPKILIFHTHSQEAFIDSRPNELDDTIVGVGKELAQILTANYNISVIHDIGQYDVVDGKIKREGSYQNMEKSIIELLEKYPSIEIIIDLHRDGVPEGVHLITEINNQPTAKIMFFNGITRVNENGMPVELPDLVNPYINENLSLSLQMQLTANELYPNFARRIYIKPYRYSLHMLPKSMLVEVGANTNTLQEAKNAMEPLAEILIKVLS
jgi:stage II sporulation protein P